MKFIENQLYKSKHDNLIVKCLNAEEEDTFVGLVISGDVFETGLIISYFEKSMFKLFKN